MPGKTFKFTISAVDNATATIERVNKRFDRMTSRLTAPARRLARRAGALGEAAGLPKVAKSLGNVAKQAEKTAASITKIGAPLLAIVGGGTLAGLAEMVTHWERIGAETERTSRMIGIAANQLTQMRGAANLMGVSSDAMTAGFQSLQDTLQDARWGRNQGAFAALQALGIKIHTTNTGAIDVHAAMLDLAEVMQRVAKRDPAAARNLARSLGVEQLLPMLTQGRAAMQRYEAEAQRLRGEFTPDMAARAQAFAQSISGMGLAIDGLKASIADRLAPVLGPLIDRFATWIAQNREVISQDIGATIERVANALEQIVSRVDLPTFIKSVGDAVITMGTFAGTVLSIINALGGFSTVAHGLAAYISGRFLLSVVSSAITIGRSLIALGALAWANPIVLEIGAIVAGLGAIAFAAYKVLKYFHLLSGVTNTLGNIASKLAGLAGFGSDNATPGIPALPGAGAQTGGASGTWTTAPGVPQGAAAPAARASVAQWAQRLNFAGLEKQYGLPAGLLAGVAQIESRGNAGAMSPKGAAGLFQFMPATAREYGINPMDPAQAANAAAKKLGGLYKRYGGNLGPTLAAYNWGEGNLERRGIANAPLETRLYGPKVMGAMQGYGGNTGAPLAPLNAPPPPTATTAPPVVNVSTQVHVERDGRTRVSTQTPNGLNIAYPLATY